MPSPLPKRHLVDDERIGLQNDQRRVCGACCGFRDAASRFGVSPVEHSLFGRFDGVEPSEISTSHEYSILADDNGSPELGC